MNGDEEFRSDSLEIANARNFVTYSLDGMV